MRFPYSFGDEARLREGGQCVSVGSEGVTAVGALRALKEQYVVGKKAIIDRLLE